MFAYIAKRAAAISKIQSSAGLISSICSRWTQQTV